MSLHHGKRLTTSGKYDVIDCESCGFAHLMPIPDMQEEKYREQYYSETKPNYFADYERDREWHRAREQWKLRALFRGVQGPRTLLDIGSGPGGLLEAAQAEGWYALGIEPNKHAWEYSHRTGVPVFHGTLIDYMLRQKQEAYQVVHMAEVLEHQANPHEMLRHAYSFARNGGLLYVETPNDFNPVQQEAVRRGLCDEFWVATPDHINYFNLNSLCKAVKRAGFYVLDCGLTFPIDLFLLMGQNYIDSPEVGPQVHALRKIAETQGMEFMNKLYGALTDFGAGREAWVLAKKM